MTLRRTAQTARRWWLLSAATALLVCAASPVAWAHEAEPPQEEEKLPEISEEEMKQLLEGLQADTKAKSSDPAVPPPPAAAPQQSGQSFVGRMLQSMNPDMAMILDVAGAAFNTRTPLQTGAHDPNKTGFTFQQLEMSLSANVDSYFRFDSNIVFGQFGVEVEEAYATTLGLPGRLQVRAGQFLTRFGRINSTHPHTWHFLDQPIVNGKFFGGEGNRGVGLEASWLVPVPWYAELVSSANAAVGDCCARSYYGGRDLGVDSPADFMYTNALKQFFPFNDDWSLMWGLTGQFGPNPTGNGNRSAIYGTDFYLRYRPIESTGRTSVALHGEAMFRSRQLPNKVLQDVGGFLQLVWQFQLRWETGLRYEFVSGVKDDPLDPEWSSYRQRIAAQGTFYPSHFSRIRLQAMVDTPTWLDKPILGAMLGLEVLVGAHGSHHF